LMVTNFPKKHLFQKAENG